jgi:hypothetical protein
MELGKHLRELFRLRLATVVCILLASFAALTASYKVDLSPPGLEPRSVTIASATSEVLVDTPLSSAVDLRQGSTDIEGMTRRATLLGNVIATPPVVGYIARRAGVPTAAIRAQAPLTADFPRPVPKPGDERSARDLVRIPEEYRINVQVDPSVPVLRVITQAPTAESATRLANAAIDGLRDYLGAIARAQKTPMRDRVRLEPLGRAQGEVINGGVRVQVSAVAFIVVFGLSAAAAVFVARVRRGWREAEVEGGFSEDDWLLDDDAADQAPKPDKRATPAVS